MVQHTKSTDSYVVVMTLRWAAIGRLPSVVRPNSTACYQECGLTEKHVQCRECCLFGWAKLSFVVTKHPGEANNADVDLSPNGKFFCTAYVTAS